MIAVLMSNPMLVAVVVAMGLTDAHFLWGAGLQAPFRFAMAGPDCVEKHVTSNYEDLSRTISSALSSNNEPFRRAAFRHPEIAQMSGRPQLP